jgi:molybdenum cofactor synthesis domain-containing protein
MSGKDYVFTYYEIIPDDEEMIREKLILACDDLKLDLLLTSGGTGFSKRDVTPEATLSVIEKRVPGIPEAIRYPGLQNTPKAMLSRAGQVSEANTLIINLPGQCESAYANLGSNFCLPWISWVGYFDRRSRQNADRANGLKTLRRMNKKPAADTYL